MEAEMSYLLEEKTRKLENAEMLIERLKREVKELDFSVALHDRSVEKARAIWKEAHPDAEFMPGRPELMVWMVEKAEKAEAVKESLTSALGPFVEAYHKGLIGAVPDVPPAFVMNNHGYPQSLFITRNLLEEMVREAESALRTAEESSVVKQQEDSANTDGDWDILNDIETSLRAKTDGMKRLLESQTLSPELSALGRELVRLAEKSLGEATE